ncbi:MAG: hypothetical protein EXX96DRAFT_76373 [Benjaminiella poitrasii]|nr:MAG: hypothetical protein EXX96DRAFT_76373 [Benjaminiella poitrasii]
MSNISLIIRNRLCKAFPRHIAQPIRYLSVSRPLLIEQKVKKTRPELLPDERLQEIVAELEKPLHRKSVSIGDTQDVMLESIESLRPRQSVITTPEMEKLYTRLNNGFTVRQLADYLRAHHLSRKSKYKKQQMLTNIIENYWGIKTHEQRNLEEMEKLKNQVKKSFSASRQELFFIFADEGESIRHIEEKNKVNVTIDVENFTYIIEGASESVEAAKNDIDSQLTIIEGQMNLPEQMVDNTQLRSELVNALSDMSKVSGSYISLSDDNKFSLFSLSEEKLNNAKRLLNLLLKDLVITDEETENALKNTIVQNLNEFTLLPVHDSPAMSLFDKNLNWVRTEQKVADDQKETNDFALLLDGRKIGSFDSIKDILLKPFGEHDNLKNISLEARFGYLLFQNNGNLDITKNGIMNLFKNKTLFLNTIPPHQLTSSFIPLTLDEGFHQRSVQLEYINDYGNRFQLEFLVEEDDNLKLKRTIMEKNKSVVDILGVHGNTDIRLIAKQFENYNNPELNDLAKLCKLVSYNEFSAPLEFEKMILSDITFLNKKRYLFNDNLININHVEQQDKLAKRTELTVASVDPNTLDITDSIERWPSFSRFIENIAHKWVYYANENLVKISEIKSNIF